MAKTGIQLIDQAIGKFQGIIDDIESGITKNVVEKDKNRTKIITLQNANINLVAKNEEGMKFADNLKKMLK